MKNELAIKVLDNAEKMLKDEIKLVVIIPDKEDCKLLVDIDEERKELFSYGLKFLPLNKFCEWFEKNFDPNYGTDKSDKTSFFIRTTAYDIIKEYKEFKKEIKRHEK